MTLDEIAIEQGCDKSSEGHNYCGIYEEYFIRLKKSAVRLLEIGYGGYDDPDKGGESASMWVRYFGRPVNDYSIPDGYSITITDIYPKNNIPDGVLFLQLDVTTFPLKKYGWYDNIAGYDIIIDDGSHLNADIIEAFKNLWPALAPGGLYCIEDTHSSYDPYYKDSSFTPGNPGTAMEFFTRLCHVVNADFIAPSKMADVGILDFTSTGNDGQGIEFIHFYKDLIIIKKKA